MKTSADLSKPYDWNCSTVRLIIEKPEYMGHTVNFRSHKESYKDNHATARPPEEWKVFENTHEAIVDPETWALAQRVRETVRRTDSTGVANPLTGLVYCADCGAKMYNHRHVSRAIKAGKGPDPVSGLYPYDCFNCSTYMLSVHRTNIECTAHHISTKALRALLLDTIRAVSTYAISNEAEFWEKVRVASQIQQKEAAKEMQRKLKRDRKRSAELDHLIKRPYESLVKEQITEKRFELLSAEYEREQEELTTPMIFEFVDRIIVHAPEKIDGERSQEVEIFLKFIGRFDVPMPEPTPEELAQQEKLRRRRARDREKLRRWREQVRREKAAAEAEGSAVDTGTKE